MDEPRLKQRRDGTMIQVKPLKDKLLGALILGVILLVFIGMVMVGRADRNDTPPNPCEGQSADTGVSEECQEFIDWTVENP